MTTGRINQVTTFRPCIPNQIRSATPDSHNLKKSLSRSGVRQTVNEFNYNLSNRSAETHTS